MNKRKYSKLSNIIYALKKIWLWDKKFYLFLIPIIPISILLPLLSNYFPKILVDLLISNSKILNILYIILIYFVIVFIINIVNNFCHSKLQSRRYTISCIYQNKINEKLMRTDYSNIDNPEFNIKYSNVISDACSGNCAPEFIWKALLDFCISLLGIITYGILIFNVSPLILLYLFISALIVFITGKLIIKYKDKNKEKYIELDRKIGYISGFSSKFDYAKDIRLYGMSSWLIDILTGFQKERLNWSKKIYKRIDVASVINSLMILLRDSIAYFILINSFVQKEITIGDFVFYFGIITSFSMWLNGLANKINIIYEYGLKIGYYREYFDIVDKFNHNLGCDLPTGNDLPVELELRNVSFKYYSNNDDAYALKDINLNIKKGEKIAIVGYNGAGKTTLIKLVCGLYYPTEGEIFINQKKIEDYNIEEFYSIVSAVFQDIHLLPCSIKEFIASSTEVIDDKKVEEVLELSGLKEKVMNLPEGVDSKLMKGVFDNSIELSGGEKQKLILARALYKNAPLLILDEPTAALDPIAENKLYLKYSELTKGKTSIYISHRLASTIFCDRIIFLKDGMIKEVGTHQELIDMKGDYYEMFVMQSKYYKEEE